MFRHHHRGPAISILLALGLIWSVAAASAAGRTSVIVVFDDSVSDPAALAGQLGRAHDFTARHVYGTALKGFAASIPAGAMAALVANPRVVAVEAETVESIVDQSLPTGIDRIEVDKNPTVTTNGTGSKAVNIPIAIIDTGIQPNHPDLNVAGGFAAAGNTWSDGNGHGTHVAGTAAAKDNGTGVVGVAPGAPVWAVRVCGNGGMCMSGDIVKGIDWVAARKADFKDGVPGGINFAAANFSISSADSNNSCSNPANTTHRAICGLVNQGVVFVMAAGNDARAKTAYPVAFTVAAIADFNGKAGGGAAPTCRTDEDDTLANFSNWGVDIAAPGTCILSTWLNSGYNTISGTSMATPHVTGAVALYIHANAAVNPATDSGGVADIESAIVGAALAQSHACGYTNERGTSEKLLFVNGSAFGGDGSCDTAGSPPSPSNTAPTANNVSVTTSVNTAVAVTLSGSDAEQCELTFSIVTPPTKGSLSTIGNNACSSGSPNTDTASVTYTPSVDVSGSDSFTYKVNDGTLDSGTATVSVTIEAAAGGDPSTMSATLSGSSANNGSTWTATATATVKSGTGASISGALVSGTWTWNGNTEAANCTTGSNGTCAVSKSSIPKRVGSATFQVTSVLHSSFTYSGAYPLITVSKP
jgi:subtilisin